MSTSREPVADKRYHAVIEACARFIHSRALRGEKYVSTQRLAEWIANDLPTLYRETFGRTPKRLKAWRVRTLISNAAFLGAFEDLDVKSTRGRGFSPTVEPKKKVRRKKGGRK